MFRPLLIAFVGAAAAAAAIGLNYALWQEEDAPPAEQVAAQSPPPKTTAAQPDPLPIAPPKPIPPSFDVVRVNPQGDTVMAGRAEPGRHVVILDGKKVIGLVTADEQGEWVFVPDKPLPPGNRQLRLEMRQEGTESVLSEESVVLVVPEKGRDIAGQPAKKPTQALVLKVPSGGGPSIVLQKPSLLKPTPKPVPKIESFRVTVDTVDYDDTGKLSISGRASPNAMVQIYLDNGFIGRALAGKDQVWTLSPEAWVEPGLYRLRADHVNEAGKVLQRVEFPFSRAEPPFEMTAGTFVVVQPGNSLWRLARSTYGSGIQYTVIFEANADQIKDEDLIYPGQVFALPTTN